MLAALRRMRAGRLRRPGDRRRDAPHRTGRGYAAHRLAARLRLPRPAGLGLAAPFARPARTAVTLAAIAFGATAVIFAFGLSSSLNRADQSQHLIATVPVQIQQFHPGAGPGQVPTATQNAALTAALRAEPGTLHEVPVYTAQVKVPGVAQNVQAWAFGGDASWTGYGLIAGRWYDAPGEVDVNTSFLNAERPCRRRHGHGKHRHRPGHGADRGRGVPAGQAAADLCRRADPAAGSPPARTSGSGTWGCARAPARPPTSGT